MSERFADLEIPSRARQSLDTRVEAYPGLRAKIERMLFGGAAPGHMKGHDH